MKILKERQIHWAIKIAAGDWSQNPRPSARE
jgi:hypothetical protein